MNKFCPNILSFVSYAFKNKECKKLYGAFFYGWCSTASRLEPLWGGSLLFTTTFPEIPGTHFIDLGRMKSWVNLGATQWFWTWDPWIGNPAPYPLGHCSCLMLLKTKNVHQDEVLLHHGYQWKYIHQVLFHIIYQASKRCRSISFFNFLIKLWHQFEILNIHNSTTMVFLLVKSARKYFLVEIL